MAPRVLIDLCLSTDDERLPQLRQSHSKLNTSVANTDLESLHVSCCTTSVDVDDQFADEPRKKIKLSSSCKGDDHVSIDQPGIGKRRGPPTKRVPLARRVANGQHAFIFSDDIVFNSSEDANAVAVIPSEAFKKQSTAQESDNSLPDDAFSTLPANGGSLISTRTASLLAKLQKPRRTNKSLSITISSTEKVVCKKDSRSPKARQTELSDATSSEGEEMACAKTTKKPRCTEVEKTTKLRMGEEAKARRIAQRAREKDEEKARKKSEREDKAREKQRAADLAEVNKAKKDRKETCKEMIVDIPMSIQGQRVDDQIREFLKNLGIESNTYQSSLPNIIRWRRKVDSRFDNVKGYRIAIPKELHNEKHLLCLMSAKEFIALLTADPTQGKTQTLLEHVQMLRAISEGCSPIYLIEGFQAWMRKNKNLRNREYQAAVLNQVHNDVSVASAQDRPASRRKHSTEAYVDEDLIEDALLHLQIMNDCLIHHTATPFESAEWVANFTQHISLIPYRYVESNNGAHGVLIQEQKRDDANRYHLLYGERPSQDWR